MSDTGSPDDEDPWRLRGRLASSLDRMRDRLERLVGHPSEGGDGDRTEHDSARDGENVDEDVDVERSSEVRERPLSDEEQVVSQLRPRGGRARQSVIVENTAWSKSKVSRLLSRMEENGRIRRMQVGREKVVCLPGEEPEAFRSPFTGDNQSEGLSQ